MKKRLAKLIVGASLIMLAFIFAAPFVLAGRGGLAFALYAAAMLAAICLYIERRKRS